MFSSKNRKAQEAVAGLDYSSILRNPSAWGLGHLANLGIGGELTAMTYGMLRTLSSLLRNDIDSHFGSNLCQDPVQSLLAVGTEHGKLFVFGAPGVQLSWDIGIPTKIRHLAFKAGSGFLCVVGESTIESPLD